MGENQEVNNSPLDAPSFDYTKLDEVIQGNVEQQKLLNDILEVQKKMVDYFVPTEDELLKLEEEERIKQEQLEEEELQKQNDLLYEKELQQEYNQQILQQLTLLNENISKVEFTNQNTNAYLYILCFGFLFAFVISFIYKTIRKFL